MLNNNEICKILERTLEKENIEPYGEFYWYKVSKGDIQGWIFGRFLSEETNDINVEQGIINGRFVNVRLKPDINSTIIGRVYQNEKCMVLEKSENETYLNDHGSFYWYKIRTNRNEGWIFGKFVEFK
ncbi:MAG: SH3 domain-containing protein [Saprospiraceae bacterium]|nr:SH3 domain-containing protein [Saprospiraceae bacterium]